MTNNDVLRSLRFILNVNDAGLAEMINAGGSSVTANEVAHILLFDSEPDYSPCDDQTMANALDGLVYLKRGKDPSRPAPAQEMPITNNTVLKKCRVAFELKDNDMHAILESVDFVVSKPELSALFRKPGHKNFRPCGDQLLRNFLKGLALREQAKK